MDKQNKILENDIQTEKEYIKKNKSLPPNNFKVPLLIMLIILTLSFIGLLAVYFLNIDFSKGNTDKTLVSSERTISDFDSILIEDSFNVKIICQEENKVQIQSSRGDIEEIKTVINDNTLIINNSDEISLPDDTTILIHVPILEKLTVTGASNVILENFINEQLNITSSGAAEIYVNGMATRLIIETSGAGKIRLVGKSDKLFIHSSGVGEINADMWKTQEATIDISGAGNARVNAVKILNISISGEGNVKYVGSPEIQQEISGFGTVTQLKNTEDETLDNKEK